MMQTETSTNGYARPTQYPIANSNIELFGSDVEKRIKQYAAEHEQSFYVNWTGDSKTSVRVGGSPGITIWRVHNIAATYSPDSEINPLEGGKMLTPPKFGVDLIWTSAESAESAESDKMNLISLVQTPVQHFFSGDSYIVLHTQAVGRNAINMYHNIYFWLGSESTQDEWGVAAYKTVELDDLLSNGDSGSAIQHREIQGNESQQFLSLFHSYGGFMAVPGGYDSGFHRVGATNTSFKPRLYRFEAHAGSLYSRIVPVDLNVSSLSSNEAYILDAGLQIYQWFGSDLHSPLDKFHCEKTAIKLRSDRQGKPSIYIVGEDRTIDASFWKLLGLDQTQNINSIGTKNISVRARGERSLFRVTGAAAYVVNVSGDIHNISFNPIEFSNINFKTIEGILIVDIYTNVFVCWYPHNDEQETTQRLFGIGQLYQQKVAAERNDPKFLKVSITVVKNNRNFHFSSLHQY